MGSLEPQKACAVICELFGEQAALFESRIVPLWQGTYDSLVNRARITKGSRVLDVGSGTGEVALRLGRLVGRTGHVVAVDAQPEMLRIAKGKGRDGSLQNIEFKEMPMEAMNLPEDSFDSVVGNYSLCCSIDYGATLSECLRVLKPGGRLTYNHGGPTDPLATQVILRIFESYKTKSPSRHLREIREAEAVQAEAVEKYREPSVTLDEMRKLGYHDAEATMTQRRINYTDAGAFVDEWLLLDWNAETKEIPVENLRRFRREAVEALSPLSKGAGFTAESEMVFFTGTK
jgi:ubiquinone/menaquinone biosynthesis C-methylase UbiE